MRPRLLELEFSFHPLLHASGVPHRINNSRRFDINNALSQIEVSSEQLVNANHQRRMIHEAFVGEPGWLMFACTTGVIEQPRVLAANVCQRYFERDLKLVWLSQFDRLDRVRFPEMRLVVLDALFFDSPPQRRDRIYEVINSRCNFEHLSVLVVGQHSSPLAMSQQLGLRPNFMVQFR